MLEHSFGQWKLRLHSSSAGRSTTTPAHWSRGWVGVALRQHTVGSGRKWCLDAGVQGKTAVSTKCERANSALRLQPRAGRPISVLISRPNSTNQYLWRKKKAAHRSQTCPLGLIPAVEVCLMKFWSVEPRFSIVEAARKSTLAHGSNRRDATRPDVVSVE